MDMREKIRFYPFALSGRHLVRGLSTAVTLILAVIVGTIFRQNIEELSTQVGLDNVLKNSTALLGGVGSSTYLVWLFFFFLGVSSTLWIDTVLKNRALSSSRANIKGPLSRPSRRMARIYYSFSDKKFVLNELVLSASATEVVPDRYSLSPVLRNEILGVTFNIDIEFAQPIVDAAVVLVGERGAVNWKINKIGQTHISLDVKGDLAKYQFVIEVAESARSGERFKLATWYTPVAPQLANSPPIFNLESQEVETP